METTLQKPQMSTLLLEASYQAAMGGTVEGAITNLFDGVGSLFAPAHSLPVRAAQNGVPLEGGELGGSLNPGTGKPYGETPKSPKSPPPKWRWYKPWTFPLWYYLSDQ